MKPERRRFWLVVRLVVYAVLLLLAIAVTVPNFLPVRFESSGVPVSLKILVVDAQNGAPVAGARTLVWLLADERWPINTESVGEISATTYARGTCEVLSSFPGSGTFKKGRLRVNSLIWVRADGYEPWQKPTSELLGKSVIVTNAFSSTNAFTLKISLTRKPA